MRLKTFLLLTALLLLGFGASAQFTFQSFPLCWDVGGQDSSIYRIVLYTDQASAGMELGYYDKEGNEITVSGGSLSQGLCSRGDTLNVVQILDPNCGVSREVTNQRVTGAATTTIAASTYYAVSIVVVTGAVDITMGAGSAQTVPTGYILNIESPHPCEYIETQIEIDTGSGDEVIITYMQ
jgi:hypothetical protein